MFRLLSVLLLALLAVQIAWAQDAPDEEAAEEPTAVIERVFETFTASDHGFRLDLPDTGVIRTPADEGWDKEDQIAFEWLGAADDPVRMIQARVDSFGKELDEESFELFSGALLQNWAGDEQSFTVMTSNKELRFGDHIWNLIEVEDRTNAPRGPLANAGGEGRTVYYSVFTTFAGDNLYTITMYYLQPVSKEVETLGVPILKSFAAL